MSDFDQRPTADCDLEFIGLSGGKPQVLAAGSFAAFDAAYEAGRAAVDRLGLTGGKAEELRAVIALGVMGIIEASLPPDRQDGTEG